ncbi:phospholipase A-2-activating protein [Sparassis latifolia]
MNKKMLQEVRHASSRRWKVPGLSSLWPNSLFFEPSVLSRPGNPLLFSCTIIHDDPRYAKVMPYKLSATLAAHSSDVRAVVSPSDDLILSASRDCTAISWMRSSPTSSFAQAAVLKGSSRYINAVTYLPPSPDAPLGYAVTGGQDSIINIYSLANTTGEPNFSLLGHTENVCALHTGPDGEIISGSWDRTAKVWRDFQLAFDLKGHQQSVWAVLAVDGRQFLTGSADNTIKLWNQHKNVRTYPGHTQAVRGLTLITDIGFASCSNDSEIRIWTMEGDVVYTLSGHTSFVYSLSVLPSGDIVSGGEDRTVRIWRDGECAQTIVHPALSVWCVSTMPNGDIVTACSDGAVRVFSDAEARWAPAEQVAAYEEQVASQALPAQQLGDVNKSDLPGVDALTQPGKKSGEVKMVQNDGTVEAHQWDSATQRWQKIGDVVDAVGSGRKQLYEGREYDYVFDVDVQEGVPPLKLPYNANENSYSAAQRFLERNDLPMSYLDEVVRFIEKNTTGVSIGGGPNQFVDPYTGASRYQPGRSTVASGGAEYMDPFTGASRYRAPEASPPPAAPAPAYGDPWTGASRYAGTPTPSTPRKSVPPRQKITLPLRSPLLFRQANVSAMQSKLYQLDQALRNEISTSSLSMYSQELKYIDESFAILSQVVARPLEAPSTALGANHIDAIIQLLERWPPGPVFPVMDLCRLLVGFCPDCNADHALKIRLSEALFHSAEWGEAWTSPLPKQKETNVLFLFRALANMLQDSVERDETWVKGVLNELGEVPYSVLTKTLRVALATILFNLSCIGLRERLKDEIWTKQFNLVLQILQAEQTDSEAAYRALVALGNTVYAAKDQERPLGSSRTDAIRQCLSALSTTFPEDRIKDVTSEITPLL